MLVAYGWVRVRSSLDPLRNLRRLEAHERSNAEDAADDAIDKADELLFDQLESFLSAYMMPDLDWHFRRHMNNERGILLFSSSTNHRGTEPSALCVLRWLAEHGPDSYGLVYIHDDEDSGESARMRGRDGRDRSNEFRVWRLRGGDVSELDDPFLSPMGSDPE